MRTHAVKVVIFALICAAGLIPLKSLAQVTTATVSGVVKDASGGVVPGTKIVATKIATGTITRTESNASGQYNLSFLPPGAYNITAEAAGFKKYERKNLALSVADHPMIDITLVPGAVQETVFVTAEVPLLGTADANLGSVVQSEQVESLPLNGRTPMASSSTLRAS
jgi:hypothetical protein